MILELQLQLGFRSASTLDSLSPKVQTLGFEILRALGVGDSKGC